jgi:excisionase family DNA binding protein
MRPEVSANEAARRQQQSERDREAEQNRRDHHLHDEARLRPRVVADSKKILPLAERFGINVAVAAEYVGISKSRIYELLQSGELEGRVVCGRRIVVVESLLRMLGQAPSTKREKEAARSEASP